MTGRQPVIARGKGDGADNRPGIGVGMPYNGGNTALALCGFGLTMLMAGAEKTHQGHFGKGVHAR